MVVVLVKTIGNTFFVIFIDTCLKRYSKTEKQKKRRENILTCSCKSVICTPFFYYYLTPPVRIGLRSNSISFIYPICSIELKI